MTMSRMLMFLLISALCFGLAGCIEERSGCQRLPWNMTDSEFSEFCSSLGHRAAHGEDACFWDLIQMGRISDGARSESIGESVGVIWDVWGLEKFTQVVRHYPGYAQIMTEQYLAVARGAEVAEQIKISLQIHKAD